MGTTTRSSCGHCNRKTTRGHHAANVSDTAVQHVSAAVAQELLAAGAISNGLRLPKNGSALPLMSAVVTASMQALHAYGCWVIELLSRWTTVWGRTPLEPLAAAKRAFSAAPMLPLRSFARAVCALPSRLNVPQRMRGTGRGALAWRWLHLPPSHSLEPLSRSPRATAHCGKCSQQNRTATEVTAGLPGRKRWNGGSFCVRAGSRRARCTLAWAATVLTGLTSCSYGSPPGVSGAIHPKRRVRCFNRLGGGRSICQPHPRGIAPMPCLSHSRRWRNSCRGLKAATGGSWQLCRGYSCLPRVPPPPPQRVWLPSQWMAALGCLSQYASLLT